MMSSSTKGGVKYQSDILQLTLVYCVFESVLLYIYIYI